MLVGTVINEKSADLIQEMLLAKESMRHYENYKSDSIYEDKNIISSRIHQNIIGEKESPFMLDNVLCWTDGEIYNLDEIKNKFNIDASCISELIIKSYTSNILKDVLALIDGNYVSVKHTQYQQIF